MLLALQAVNDDEYNTPRVSAHLVRLALGCVLLAFQAVNDDGYNAPRVSAHIVRLALGYALLAFQAVMETGVMYPRINQRPERAAPLSPGQATAGSDTLGIMYTHPPGALKGQKH